MTISTVISSIAAVGFSSNKTAFNENVESVTEKSLQDIAEASQDEYLDDNQSDIISAETSEQSDESDNDSYKSEDTESKDNDAKIDDSSDTSTARNMDDSVPTDVSTQEPEPTLTIKDTVIATHLVNVREEPNTKCNILGEVNEGEKVDRYE